MQRRRARLAMKPRLSGMHDLPKSQNILDAEAPMLAAAARRFQDGCHHRCTSRYWSHIQRFDAAGFSDSLLLLDFDDLCQDPVGTARRVQAFVGLELEDPADVRIHNSRRTAGRVLTKGQERSYWARVRPDVEALAASGRFPAAQKWLDTWSAKFSRPSPRRRPAE